MAKIINLFKYYLFFIFIIFSINYVKTNDPSDSGSVQVNSKIEIFGKFIRQLFKKYSKRAILINEENEEKTIKVQLSIIVHLIKNVENILLKKFIEISNTSNRGIKCRETATIYLQNGGFYTFLLEANLIQEKPSIWETEPIKEKIMFKWFFEFLERLCYNLGNYLIEMTIKNKYEIRQPLSLQFVKALNCLDLIESTEEKENKLYTQNIFEMTVPDNVKIYFDMKENWKIMEFAREDNLLTFNSLSKKSFWIGELFWILEWISDNWEDIENAIKYKFDEPDIVILKFGTRLAGRLLRILSDKAIEFFNQPKKIKEKLAKLQSELKDKFNKKYKEYAKNNLSFVYDELTGSEVFVHFEEALNIKWKNYECETICTSGMDNFASEKAKCERRKKAKGNKKRKTKGGSRRVKKSEIPQKQKRKKI
uniref:Uncharacterized protein n=1 Tax=Meloidogyne hapla TaxID=6305 RepID=A0A1I8BBX7_MELHA